MKSNRIILLPALILGLALVLLLTFLIRGRISQTKIQSVPPRHSQLVFPYQSALDGSGVAEEAEVAPRVVGVMIDNYPEARPQSGLAAARVVYEVPVEYGLTRFLALYPAQSAVEKVGPVRSARPYFIDWLTEYGAALYLHSGGSPEALRRLERGSGVVDVNEFYRGDYFWRDDARRRPHNLYTSSSLWQKFIQHQLANQTPPAWLGWQWFGPVALGGASASTTTLNGGEPKAVPIFISSFMVGELSIPYVSDYVVGWHWSDSHKRYERLTNGLPAADADSAVIYADNIVVQYVAIKVLDEEGRREITTIGSGPVNVFSQGLKLAGQWRRAPGGRTRFYTPAGEEIILIPGVTWIQVVPQGTVLQIGN